LPTDGSNAWVIVTTSTASYAAKAVDLSAERSLLAPGYDDLAQLLSGLSKDLRGTATHTGDGTVAGRPTYVISVTSGCADTKRRTNAPAHMDQLTSTFWIDKETFLPLHSEDKSANLTVRYEVSRVEYNVSRAATLFQLSPPSGARIFETARDLKTALAASLPKVQKGGGAGDKSDR
jgi:outer membrane lipoprotein-sorting protein